MPTPGTKRSRQDTTLILYSYWRSSCSWRVRLMLAQKSLPYSYKAINLLKGEDCSEEYLKLNPAGLVPTLVFTNDAKNAEEQFPAYSSDDVVLPDSIAIAQYLDDIYPDTTRIFPTDPLERAQVTYLSMLIAASTQPVQNFAILQKVGLKFGDDQKIPWAKEIIQDRLAEFEVAITKTAGKYCFGDAVTFVDICLIPQIYNGRRFGVDIAQFPTITKVLANLDTIEALKAASPENQPDAVPPPAPAPAK